MTGPRDPDRLSGALSRLVRILGDDGLLRSPEDIQRYAREWRGHYHSRPLAVARPDSTANLAMLVACCAEAGIAMVPQGGNTGLVGGSVARGDGEEIIVSTERLRKVREVSTADRCMVVEAGVSLAAARRAAEDAGLMLPLDFASAASATIGGVLSTNAGGHMTLRWGNARARVLGLEVVLADGQTWNGLSRLRKDNSGYDLKQLFIGSEGTLGIIAAASLALESQPAEQETVWLAVPDPGAAVQVLHGLRARLGDLLSAFELVTELAVSLVQQHDHRLREPLGQGSPWYVLAEMDSVDAGSWLRPALEQSLSELMAQGLVTGAVIAESRQQAGAMWQIRETIPAAQAVAGHSIKHDISVPISHWPKLIEQLGSDLEQVCPGIGLCVFGHVGDGNLHFNLSQPAGLDRSSFEALEADCNRLVFDQVIACGGSIAAEHGVGLRRVAALEARADPVKLALMRTLKQGLDPANLLNPGKVLGQAPGQAGKSPGSG